MDIDQLISTIEINDENSEFKILLESMINIEAAQLATFSFIARAFANGNQELGKQFFVDYKKDIQKQREVVLQGLFEIFGHLPPNITEAKP